MGSCVIMIKRYVWHYITSKHEAHCVCRLRSINAQWRIQDFYKGDSRYMNARIARAKILQPRPLLMKPRPFKAARRVSRAFFDQKTC